MITEKQKRKFKSLCNQIAKLHAEIRITEPNAEIYLEDGVINIYDWPSGIDTRPDEPIVEGALWPHSGGGGR